MTHPAIIEDQAALEAFCQRAASATFLTVDTEFVREKTYYPLLCLVQVATPERILCVDPLSDIDMDACWPTLLDTPWVLHSGRQN